MFFGVDCLNGPGEVTKRPGQDHQVIGQCGGEKFKAEMNAVPFKVISGAGRKDRKGGLREGWDIPWFLAHDAIDIAVDPYEAGQTVRPAGPMHGRSVS